MSDCQYRLFLNEPATGSKSSATGRLFTEARSALNQTDPTHLKAVLNRKLRSLKSADSSASSSSSSSSSSSMLANTDRTEELRKLLQPPPYAARHGSLLHEAVRLKKVDAVRCLSEVAGFDVNEQTPDGRSPLHIACKQCDEEMVRCLLELGADPNLQTFDGKSPLHLALWRQCRPIVDGLLSAGANGNIADSDGWISLHWSTKVVDVQLTRQLIFNGASLNYVDCNGFAPFHRLLLSSTTNNFERVFTMIVLLIQHGADPNIPTRIGSTLRVLYVKCPSLFCRSLAIWLQEACYDLQQDRDWLAKETALNLCLEDSQQELLSELSKISYRVPNLKWICRLSIRRCLNRRLLGRSIVSTLSKLPLPEAMLDFVKMQNELQWRQAVVDELNRLNGKVE